MTMKSVCFLGTCHTSVQKSVFRMRGFRSAYDILNSFSPKLLKASASAAAPRLSCVSMSLTQQELFWSVPGATKSGYINSFTCRSLYSSLQSPISDFVVLLKRHVIYIMFQYPCEKASRGPCDFQFRHGYWLRPWQKCRNYSTFWDANLSWLKIRTYILEEVSVWQSTCV